MNRNSILLRIRNEGPYLIEWIAHYVELGFDDIVIVHNENDDGSTRLLELLEQNGICRVFESPVNFKDGVELTPGQRAVATIKEQKVLAQSKWLFTADADELLILKQHCNISEFIEAHADSEQILFSWDLFVPDLKSSGFDGDFNMRCRFSSVTDDHSHIKSLSRIDRYPGKIAPHRIISRSKKTTLADGREIDPVSLSLRNWKSDFDRETETMLIEGKSAASLYHYRFKSAVEFCMRQTRGVAGPHSLKNNGMFFIRTMLSNPDNIRTIDQFSGCPTIADFEQGAQSLLSLPGVSEVQEQINQDYLRQAADIETNSLTYRFIRAYLDAPNDFSASETSMQLLEGHPQSSEMLWLAAFCHRHDEKFQQAYQLSLKAIEQSPEHATHHRFFVNNMKKAAEMERSRLASKNLSPTPQDQPSQPQKWQPEPKKSRFSLSGAINRLLRKS